MNFYIVTPALNAAPFIAEAINSVVAQAGDFTIFYHVQDGGSTDATCEILQQWETILSSGSALINCRAVHFSWSSEPDTGMYDAINKGFSRFTMPPQAIMAWVNTDDFYIPGAFATAAKAFTDNPSLQWLGGRIFLAKEGVLESSSPGTQPYPPELVKNYCCDYHGWRYIDQAATFWKASLWHSAGPLNTAFKYAGDYELWPRFAQHADCVYLPLELCCYRVHKAQLSQQGRLYEQEKDSVQPFSLRSAYIQSFWKKRILPPKAPVLQKSASNTFYIEWQRAWPLWGSGIAYYLARIRYHTKSAWTAFTKIIFHTAK